jgi:hypothetical protein
VRGCRSDGSGHEFYGAEMGVALAVFKRLIYRVITARIGSELEYEQ